MPAHATLGLLPPPTTARRQRSELESRLDLLQRQLNRYCQGPRRGARTQLLRGRGAPNRVRGAACSPLTPVPCACRLETRMTADVAAIMQLLQRQAALVPPAYSALSSPPQPPGPEPPLQPVLPITPIQTLSQVRPCCTPPQPAPRCNHSSGFRAQERGALVSRCHAGAPWPRSRALKALCLGVPGSRLRVPVADHRLPSQVPEYPAPFDLAQPLRRVPGELPPPDVVLLVEPVAPAPRRLSLPGQLPVAPGSQTLHRHCSDPGS